MTGSIDRASPDGLTTLGSGTIMDAISINLEDRNGVIDPREKRINDEVMAEVCSHGPRTVSGCTGGRNNSGAGRFFCMAESNKESILGRSGSKRHGVAWG